MKAKHKKKFAHYHYYANNTMVYVPYYRKLTRILEIRVNFRDVNLVER